MTNGSLMKDESIAECSYWGILQYFWPALSDNWCWNPLYGCFESGSFRYVLLYTIFNEDNTIHFSFTVVLKTKMQVKHAAIQ